MMVLWEKEELYEKDLVKVLYLKANTLTDLLKKLATTGITESVGGLGKGKYRFNPTFFK